MQSSIQNEDIDLPDDTELWRRIPSDNYKFDDNLGRLRPKSNAFTDSKNKSPMSVTVVKLYLGGGKTKEEYIAKFMKNDWGLASITVGLIKELNLEIEFDPNDDDPGHALVKGKKTGKIKRRMAKESKWEVTPESKNMPD